MAKKQSKYDNAYSVGHTFGVWTLLDSSIRRLPYGGGGYGEPSYLVRCECGIEKEVSCTRLVKGVSTSCGCWFTASGSANPNWQGTETVPGRYVSRVENSAAKRGISYSLTANLMQEQLVSQNFSCSLSGQPLVFGTSHSELNTNASLDRIDSSKGYVSGNIQWVTKEVNMAKQQMGQQEFINMCKMVTEKNNG